MKRFELSSDVLAANPGLDLKPSKAKTPSGKGHGHTDDAQDYPQTPRDPHGAWLSMTRQALADNEYFAAQCRADDAIPVVTARAALRNLIEFLERHK